MTQQNRQILTVLGPLALLVLYWLWRNRRTSRLVLIKPLWNENGAIVQSPFGRIKILDSDRGENDPSDLHSNGNYNLGFNRTADGINIYLIHQDENDPVTLETIRLNFDDQQSTYSNLIA